MDGTIGAMVDLILHVHRMAVLRCTALCCCPVQIYVEVERAQLTLELAKMKEDEGDIEEAARVLQELQVSLCRSWLCAVLSGQVVGSGLLLHMVVA